MSILVENTINEIAYAGGINTAKPINATATGTFASASVTGAFTVGGTFAATGAASLNGGATVLGTLTATGTVTVPSGVAVGPAGPQILTGTLTPPANPTGVSAPLGSLYLNLGATGVTNRVYINTNGATGWTYLATSGA